MKLDYPEFDLTTNKEQHVAIHLSKCIDPRSPTAKWQAETRVTQRLWVGQPGVHHTASTRRKARTNLHGCSLYAHAHHTHAVDEYQQVLTVTVWKHWHRSSPKPQTKAPSLGHFFKGSLSQVGMQWHAFLQPDCLTHTLASDLLR